MGKLDGRTVIVTGAARGIGAAMAARLGAEGAKVVVNYVRAEKSANDVAAAIRAAGGDAIAVQADVGKEAEVQRLFAQTGERYGRPDVVISNAAILEYGRVEGLEHGQFQRLFETNVWGFLLVSREATRAFGDKGGRIIAISSNIVKAPYDGFVVYAATKGAIESAVRCLATELGPRNITVNCIAPGPVYTDMTAPYPQEAMDATARAMPLRRIGQPDDVAGAAVFLASDDARWITGQVFGVNGGAVF
jgi:3-oxoacyl-[acyl-carrier protein] reductase